MEVEIANATRYQHEESKRNGAYLNYYVFFF
jgi:hypothetical protein